MSCPLHKNQQEIVPAAAAYLLTDLLTCGGPCAYTEPGLAAVEQLRQTDPKALEDCAFVAGLSLGEYTAMVHAGAMSFVSHIFEVIGIRLNLCRQPRQHIFSDELPQYQVAFGVSIVARACS